MQNARLHPVPPALLSATDESQGAGQNISGGLIGRAAGRRGAEIASCEPRFGVAGTVSARFLPEFAQRRSSPVWSASR